jgi:DNA-binding MarR family transcriptional regulator
MTLVVTKAAFATLGIDPQEAPEEEAESAVEAADSTKTPSRTKSRASRTAAPHTRADSKQAQLIAMLRRAKGATIDEIVEALEWQPHTVRGAIAGALKKKLGLEVTSEKDERRGRVYRVTE